MRRIKENIRLFDYVNLAFYFFMLTLILINTDKIPMSDVMLLMYLSIIVGTVFLIENEHINSLFRFLRFFYPYIFIGFVFESLGFIVPFINPHNKDQILISIDRSILGSDAALIFNVLNVKGVVDYLQISYLAYYVLPIVITFTCTRKTRSSV